MSYTVINDAEIDPNKPIKSSIAYRLRDNVLAIIAGLAGAPKIQWAALATVPGQNMVVRDSPGTYSFTVPDGVTSIEFEAIGSGSLGQMTNNAGDPVYGGGGGERRFGRLAVTPGEALTLVVAAVATWGGGGFGASSFIKRGATTLVEAKGGTLSGIQCIGGTGGTGGTGENGGHGGVAPWAGSTYECADHLNGHAAGSSTRGAGCGGIYLTSAFVVVLSPGSGRIIIKY